MQIGNQDVTVNLLMLFMEHELDVTLLTIAHLVPQLGHGVTLSVLHNGSGLAPVGAKIDALDHVRFYEAGKNLGVAGGRNYLLATDECKACDVVMLIDNDVIPPVDYVARAAAFLLEHDDAGVVGASVVLFRKYQPHLPPVTETGALDQRLYRLTHQDVRRALQTNPDEPWFDHLGVHPDWQAVYLRGDDQIDMVCKFLGVDDEPTFYALLKNDPAICARLIHGTQPPLKVSNIPGCCQTFRRTLVNEIGPLCDAFNPYGFEDVDFCVRALRRGYTNYVDPQGFLLHGTDTRHVDRTRPAQERKQERNRTRCLTILAHRHAPDRVEELIKKRILTRCLLRSARGLSVKESLHAQLVGFKAGQQQIQAGLVPPVEIEHART